MKSTTTSILAHAFYMILINGLGLMFMPAFILDLFGFEHTEQLWSFRMIGALAFALGVYYYVTAKRQLKPLYGWSVVIRYVVALFMVGLWLTGEVEIMILCFAAVDAIGATWTWWTMGFPFPPAKE